MIRIKPTNVLIAVIFLFVAVASAQYGRKIDIDKSSGFCVSNTDRPRSVTNAEKSVIHQGAGPGNTERYSERSLILADGPCPSLPLLVGLGAALYSDNR
jgi:hypothetical protein